MRSTGDYYKLTQEGWKFVDQHWALRILDTLELDKFIEDKDVADAVGLTDGQPEIDEALRHLERLEEEGCVKIAKHMTGWSARILQKGVTRRRHRPIA